MAKPHLPESGFALLLIFCLAAIVAIAMYTATPRVAFEAQRDQEQLLIDRGEQYKRAIQLYYRAFHRYPAKMEDLENTANQRFLRRRYTDPISGKEEWRLIHVGPGGMLIDSVNQTAKKPGSAGSVNNFITELPALGANLAGIGNNESLAQRRRPSDQPGAAGNGAPLDPNAIADAAANGVSPSTPPGFGPDGRPLPPGGLNAGGYPIQPGVNPVGQQPPGAPGVSPNIPGGYPNPTGAYAVNSVPGMSQTPPGQPTAPPANNQASQMIQRLLTSPRPGGFPGQPPGFDTPAANIPSSAVPDQFGNALTPAPAVTGGLQAAAPGQPSAFATNAIQQPGQTIGGGIAGVASTVEREGIKVYNEKTKYNQWEFIYDFGKENAAANQTRPGTQPPGAAPGATPGATSGSGFNTMPQSGSPAPIRP